MAKKVKQNLSRGAREMQKMAAKRGRGAQQEWADVMGFSIQRVNNWVLGRRTPDARAAHTLERTIGIKTEWWIS